LETGYPVRWRLNARGLMNRKEFGAALEQASMDVVIDKNDVDAIADFVEKVAGKFHREKHEEG